MVVKNEIDQNLIDQCLNDFINDVLLTLPTSLYTSFYYSYNDFDFYLKAKDLLIPSSYVDSKGFYKFNTYTILRLNIKSLNVYAQLPKEEFQKILLRELNKQGNEYLLYTGRLENVTN